MTAGPDWRVKDLRIAQITVTATEALLGPRHIIPHTRQLVVAILNVDPAALHQYHDRAGPVCPQSVAVRPPAFQRLITLDQRPVARGRRTFTRVVVYALGRRGKLRRWWQDDANCTQDSCITNYITTNMLKYKQIHSGVQNAHRNQK